MDAGQWRAALESLAKRLTAVGHLEINSSLINSFKPLSLVLKQISGLFSFPRRHPAEGLICIPLLVKGCAITTLAGGTLLSTPCNWDINAFAGVLCANYPFCVPSSCCSGPNATGTTQATPPAPPASTSSRLNPKYSAHPYSCVNYNF